MAAIDRSELLADVKFWLPSGNSVDDAGINKISELVITRVGDDDSKYGEVLCGVLRAVADKNRIDSSVSSGSGVRSRRVDDIEVQFFSRTQSGNAWEEYLRDLPAVCSQFGYSPTDNFVSPIKINPGDKIDVNPDCPNISQGDLYL